MATRVLGSLETSSSTSEYFYTVTETDDKYELTLYGGYYTSQAISGSGNLPYKCTMTGTGQTDKVATGNFPSNIPAGDHTVINSYTWSWDKTFSEQNVTVSCKMQTNMGGTWRDWAVASKTFTIPAKPSSRVTVYDDNGDAQTGIVFAYDDNGNKRNCIVSVYDENGDRHYIK